MDEEQIVKLLFFEKSSEREDQLCELLCAQAQAAISSASKL